MSKNAFPLYLGQRVNLLILSEKFDVVVRGWRTNQYLITDAPQVNSETYRVVSATGCEINFVKDGEFISFNSSVINIYSSVVALMLMEYPRKFEINKLRKNFRFKTNFPVSYSIKDGAGDYQDFGTLRDLSSTGALITHQKQLDKTQVIHLTVNLAGGGLTEQECIVRNIRINSKSPKESFVSGVKFSNISAENKKALDNFINVRVGDRRKKSR